ncbi:MAG: hypothetical protein NC314_13270 [Roseburia sp.]|nr:hypothetical protein [Roseburia sp.]MCM1243807.1 hypothetical protein [Roseburia sp.]
MEENKKKEQKKMRMKKLAEFLLMFLVSGLIAGVGTLLYKHNVADIICNSIMVMLGSGIVIFALVSSEVNGLYFYDHKGNYRNFVILYLISLVLAVIFPLLPASAWPFLVVFIILSLFSNSISGLAAGSVCLMLAVMMLPSGGSREFSLYFFSGLVGIMVFSRLDNDFKVGLPIITSLLSLLVCLSANIILFERERLSLSQFTYVAINLMINLILLLIILKIFNGSVIHRYRDKYMDINDPEFPLLVQLKEMNKDEYYHAVHTAYLGDRIAKRLSLDDVVVKACGYYHRIGILKGENNWENVEAICAEYHIPPDTRDALREYVDPKVRTLSRATTVILFADSIVTAINNEFMKNPKAEVDYGQIIDTVFAQKMESGVLYHSDISIAQLREMKKIFNEEKLYYDFLR